MRVCLNRERVFRESRAGDCAGIFTHLAVLYANHKPQLLREHLEVYWQRISMPSVISAVEQVRLVTESLPRE